MTDFVKKKKYIKFSSEKKKSIFIKNNTGELQLNMTQKYLNCFKY